MQRFTPDKIPSKLPNLVYIEGPNSSGKSTLLNIIALGLFGMKSNRINPVLIGKIGSLLNSDYQQLKFSIQITSESENLILRAEKPDLNRTEIIVKESTDGQTYKPLSFENFERKYNLIYDIPSNPAKRLPDLLIELKEEQLRYGNRFKDFGLWLRGIINQIANYRDPQRLKDISQKLDQFKKERREINEKLPELRGFLDILERHVYLKYYYFYSNEVERLEHEKEELEKKSKKLGKSGQDLSGKLTRFRNEIARLQGDFSTTYNEVTPLIADVLPKKGNSRFKIWKEINPYATESDELNAVKIEAVYYMNLFGSGLQRMESESSFKDASTLQKVIESLKEFENSLLIIPKIKVTIGDLIKILKEENKKNYVQISKHQTLTMIRGFLEILVDNANAMQQKLQEFREAKITRDTISDKYLQTVIEEKGQLDRLAQDLENAKRKCEHYFQRCLSKNIARRSLENRSYLEIIQELPKNEELKPFLSLSEKQLEEKILDLGKETAEKGDRSRALDTIIDQYQKEKDRLEKQKPHKYEKYRDQLDELLRKIDSMSQKLLNEYNNYVKSLIEEKARKEDIESDDRKRRYYEEVSRYLAHRMGAFRHIDTIYTAKIVDLISGIIVTDNGFTIHIADMGTGQSQSAYILSLLNVKDDPRKIIALFDEIAMMDDNSLRPVYSKMRELYQAKKLLLGILVQKGNEIKVEALS